MITKLLEKLMEADFEDQFEPTSKEELDKRGFVPLNIKIQKIDFSKFKNLVKGKEGIVMLGAGPPLEAWITGIVEMWNERKIYNGHANDAFEDVYELTTSGGRTDLAMMFNPKADLNIGMMAMWRLQFGDCSWVSDYIVNYSKQH